MFHDYTIPRSIRHTTRTADNTETDVDVRVSWVVPDTVRRPTVHGVAATMSDIWIKQSDIVAIY